MSSRSETTPLWPATTSGTIAILNLNDQIESDDSRVTASIDERIANIERLLVRGLLRGRIADNERALELAEQLVNDSPDHAEAYFVRAKTRATFHLFSAALTDIDQALKAGIDKQRVDAERAAILQAVGRYDEALQIRQAAASHALTFETAAALAVLHAERRDCDLAEQFFDESTTRYRGVSPFPLAMLDFQRGHLWHAERQLPRARTWYLVALKRLPEFAAAQGHLAEIEAALGDAETAIARLRRVVNTADDPEFPAQLAWLLQSRGRTEESRSLLAQSAARYDELTQKHLEAFADHAAEFWLANGGGTERALRYAEVNVAIRQTPRALNLLQRAKHANSSGRAAQTRPYPEGG